jgi:Gpi18-like mannosyltransferase
MTIYWKQAHFFNHLSLNAPNLYQFIPDIYYTQGSLAGIVITVIASLAFALLPRWKRVTLTPRFLVLSATLSVAMVPFLLPKMHDRYFFGADLLSVVLVIFNPRLWFIPMLFQCSSMLAYIPIISSSINDDNDFTMLNPVAGLINGFLFVFLAIYYWRSMDQPEAGPHKNDKPDGENISLDTDKKTVRK